MASGTFVYSFGFGTFVAPPFFLLFSVRVIAAGEDEEEEEEEECSDYGGGDTAWSILSTERVRIIILEHQACRLLRC